MSSFFFSLSCFCFSVYYHLDVCERKWDIFFDCVVDRLEWLFVTHPNFHLSTPSSKLEKRTGPPPTLTVR